MEYFLAIEKNKMLAFVMAWMNLEGITLSEVSQSEKDKYHMILHVECKEQHKWTNKTEIDS